MSDEDRTTHTDWEDPNYPSDETSGFSGITPGDQEPREPQELPAADAETTLERAIAQIDDPAERHSAREALEEMRQQLDDYAGLEQEMLQLDQIRDLLAGTTYVEDHPDRDTAGDVEDLWDSHMAALEAWAEADRQAAEELQSLVDLLGLAEKAMRIADQFSAVDRGDEKLRLMRQYSQARARFQERMEGIDG